MAPEAPNPAVVMVMKPFSLSRVGPPSMGKLTSHFANIRLPRKNREGQTL
jgi:hypothetical protein